MRRWQLGRKTRKEEAGERSNQKQLKQGPFQIKEDSGRAREEARTNRCSSGGLAGNRALHTHGPTGTTLLAEVHEGHLLPGQRGLAGVVEAGGTPNVKPPSHSPCQAVVGAEGVADQSGGHAGLIAGSLPEGAADQSIGHGSPTVGSHLEAPEQGRGQHLPTKQQQPQAQGHSQPLTGPL